MSRPGNMMRLIVYGIVCTALFTQIETVTMPSKMKSEITTPKAEAIDPQHIVNF